MEDCHKFDVPRWSSAGKVYVFFFLFFLFLVKIPDMFITAMCILLFAITYACLTSFRNGSLQVCHRCFIALFVPLAGLQYTMGRRIFVSTHVSVYEDLGMCGCGRGLPPLIQLYTQPIPLSIWQPLN